MATSILGVSTYVFKFDVFVVLLVLVLMVLTFQCCLLARLLACIQTLQWLFIYILKNNSSTREPFQLSQRHFNSVVF